MVIFYSYVTVYQREPLPIVQNGDFDRPRAGLTMHWSWRARMIWGSDRVRRSHGFLGSFPFQHFLGPFENGATRYLCSSSMFPLWHFWVPPFFWKAKYIDIYIYIKTVKKDVLCSQNLRFRRCHEQVES